MTTLFPGAKWVPIPGQEKRAARRKGRGVGYHVAVYVGPSIEKIDESTGNDSHLYVRFDGSVEQNVDLDLISYAGVDGNSSMIWVETEGGADPATVETEPWTAAQVATLARILRWAHDTEGVPLQLMPDSRPASRGAGWHKQGVDPWRVPGGETWSTHYGKLCPGAAKIAQIPAVVTLAKNPDQQEEDVPQPLYLALRSDPKQTSDGEAGSGAVIMVAPGAPVRAVSSPAYLAGYQAHGVCGAPVNLAPNWFRHYQAWFTADAGARGVDPNAIAAAVAAKIAPSAGGLTVDEVTAAAKAAVTEVLTQGVGAAPAAS